jgi:hypothetical protein
MKSTILYDYMWAFPLMGGVISLLALLTPAGFLSEAGNIFSLWIWGLVSTRVFDGFDYIEDIAFSDNIFVITPSVIFSILIGVCAIVLISSAINCKKELKGVSGLKSTWLTPAILITISIIGWIISIELAFRLGPYSMSFWEYINPGFGVIGMFLGSGLAIGGYIISKFYIRQIDEIIYFVNQPKASNSPVNLIESTQHGVNIKFCPECGTKTEEKQQQFCRNCGFQLK